MKSDLIAPRWHTWLLLVSLIMPVVLRTRLTIGGAYSHPAADLIPVYLRSIILEWALFGFVAYGIWKKASSFEILLGPRWKDARAVLRDVTIGIAFALAAYGVSRLFAAISQNRSDSSNVLPRSGSEIAAWIVLAITAGIVEEAVYRGYLQTQFQRMGAPVIAAIVLQGGVFGIVHLYQGWMHVLSITVFGLLAGAVKNWRQSVRPTMIGHSLVDLAAAIGRF